MKRLKISYLAGSRTLVLLFGRSQINPQKRGGWQTSLDYKCCVICYWSMQCNCWREVLTQPPINSSIELDKLQKMSHYTMPALLCLTLWSSSPLSSPSLWQFAFFLPLSFVCSVLHAFWSRQSFYLHFSSSRSYAWGTEYLWFPLCVLTREVYERSSLLCCWDVNGKIRQTAKLQSLHLLSLSEISDEKAVLRRGQSEGIQYIHTA